MGKWGIFGVKKALFSFPNWLNFSIFVSGEFAPPISFRPTVGAVLLREGEEEDKRLRDAIS